MELEHWTIFAKYTLDNAAVTKKLMVEDVMNVNQDTGISLIVNHVRYVFH